MDKSLKNKIRTSIQSGWTYLENEQRVRGKFEGISFTEDGKEHISPTPFTTSLILLSLSSLLKCSFVEATPIRKVANKGVDYLLSEKENAYCAWNYWEKSEPLRNTLPPDLDDTALAFASIKLWRPEAIGGELLASLVHTLIASERNPGGPYNTWVTNYKKDRRWDDCDIAVNANIGYMLKLLGIKLDKLTKYFEKILDDNNVFSKYYLSPITIFYFISRAYQGKKQKEFIVKIKKLQHKNGSWGTPLMTALALSALHYFGDDTTKTSKAILFIIKTQEKGRWKKEAFYHESKDAENIWYHGADCLTTSMCIEALNLTATKENTTRKTHRDADDKASSFNKELTIACENFITKAKSVSDDFGTIAKCWAHKMRNHRWICDSLLLPYFIQQSLGKHSSSTPEELSKLTYANLCGWVGYSLLDDVLDGNETKAQILFSNFCLREMNYVYSSHFSEKSLQLVGNILNQTDIAYYSEQHFRLHKVRDSYAIGDISNEKKFATQNKSLGMVISALGVIESLAEPDRLRLQKYFVDFFHHFLTAKQDSDDAEDLIEDLSHGHMTKIGACVLVEFIKKYPERNTYQMPNDSTTFLELFWNTIFPNLLKEIQVHLVKAENCIGKMSLENVEYFQALITSLRNMIEATQKERENALAFLKTY
ncbi:MAG: hypothetical protein RL641_382 [Candidatus Parcubacteria bacterium]|jgi:hypothetical protein